MSILVLLEVTPKSGRLDELIDLFRENLVDTRAYDGCQNITTHLNHDGKTVVLVENWASKQHYEKYLAWREETGAMNVLGDLLEGPPSIRLFSAVDA